MKDQPTPFQMLTIQMTAFPVQVWANQSMCTVWPAKSESTAFATPPWSAKMYAKMYDTTTHDVMTGMKIKARQQPSPGQAIGQQRRREEAETHLDRHRDDQEEQRVPRGSTNRGVMENTRVVGPTDEGIRDAGKDVPVVEADVELAIDRIGDEEHVQERGRRQQQIRRGDTSHASATT